MSDGTPWWSLRSALPVIPQDKVVKYGARTIIMSLVLVLSLIGALLWTVFGVDPSRKSPAQFGGVEYPATVEAVLSQCGNVFVFDPPASYYGVFDTPDVMAQLDREADVEIPEHPMIVPVYGYMSGEGTLDQKVYTDANVPPRSQLLRAMYEGYTIVWFSPSLDEAARASLKMDLASYDKVVAVEWNAGELPLDRKYAFSTWNVSQSCLVWDTEVFDQFLTFVKDHPETRPESESPPEAVVVDGRLPDINPPR